MIKIEKQIYFEVTKIIQSYKIFVMSQMTAPPQCLLHRLRIHIFFKLIPKTFFGVNLKIFVEILISTLQLQMLWCRRHQSIGSFKVDKNDKN